MRRTCKAGTLAGLNQLNGAKRPRKAGQQA